MSPKVHLGTLSILMTATDLEATHEVLRSRGVIVHPIMDVGFMRVFNFEDNEGQFFAVRQR